MNNIEIEITMEKRKMFVGSKGTFVKVNYPNFFIGFISNLLTPGERNNSKS